VAEVQPAPGISAAPGRLVPPPLPSKIPPRPNPSIKIGLIVLGALGIVFILGLMAYFVGEAMRGAEPTEKAPATQPGMPGPGMPGPGMPGPGMPGSKGP
jgi:hypothetical protein